MKRNFAKDKPEVFYRNDYHGHPYYPKIYMYLILIMLVTLVPDLVNAFFKREVIPHNSWIILGIFIFSTVKAIIVITNFMHVQYENLILTYFFIASLFLLFALYILVYIDVSQLFSENVYFTEWYDSYSKKTDFNLDYEKLKKLIKH